MQTEYAPSTPCPSPTFGTPPLCCQQCLHFFLGAFSSLARTIKLILIDNFVALAARLVWSRLGESACTRLVADRRVCCVCVFNKLSLNCTMHRLHTIKHTLTYTHTHTTVTSRTTRKTRDDSSCCCRRMRSWREADEQLAVRDTQIDRQTDEQQFFTTTTRTPATLATVHTTTTIHDSFHALC